MFPAPGNNGTMPPSSALLPAGWTAYTDAKTSREYYHHASTGKTIWTRPVAPAAQATPLPAPSYVRPPPIQYQQHQQHQQPQQQQHQQQQQQQQLNPMALTNQVPSMGQHSTNLVQPIVQNYNPAQSWQYGVAQQPTPVTPHSNVQATPPHSNVQQYQRPHNQYQQPPQVMLPSNNNGWNNNRTPPQQQQQQQQINNFNNAPPTTTPFHPNNMPPPTPPNLVNGHNPQWQPKPLRPPSHHHRTSNNANNNNFQQHHHRNNNHHSAKRQYPAPHGNVNNFQSAYNNNNNNNNNRNNHPAKRHCYEQQQQQQHQHQNNPQWKKCVKCNSSKTFEFFSKRQWNTGGFKRMCKSCVDDAVIANEASMKTASQQQQQQQQASLPTTPNSTTNSSSLPLPTTTTAPGEKATMKPCSSCKSILDMDSFSKRQWAATGTCRKCKTCVDESIAANEASMAKESSKQKDATTTNAAVVKMEQESVEAANEDKDLSGDGSSNIVVVATDGDNEKVDDVNTANTENAATTPTDGLPKACSSCKKSLPFAAYSKRQWNSSISMRKCKSCVEKFLAEYPTMQAAAARAEKRKAYSGGNESQRIDGTMHSGDGSHATAATVEDGSSASQSIGAPVLDGSVVSNQSNKDPVANILSEIANATKTLKPCSQCNVGLSESSYTPSEWTKSESERRCNFCTGNPTQGSSSIIIANHNSTSDGTMKKACSSCKLRLAYESYSKRQWSSRADVRKCKSCVAEFLVEYPTKQAEAARAEKQKMYGGEDGVLTSSERPVEDDLLRVVKKEDVSVGVERLAGDDSRAVLTSERPVEDDILRVKKEEDVSVGEEQLAGEDSRAVADGDEEGDILRVKKEEDVSVGEEQLAGDDSRAVADGDGEDDPASESQSVTVDIIVSQDSLCSVNDNIEDKDHQPACLVDGAHTTSKENDGSVVNHPTGDGSQVVAADKDGISESAIQGVTVGTIAAKDSPGSMNGNLGGQLGISECDVKSTKPLKKREFQPETAAAVEEALKSSNDNEDSINNNCSGDDSQPAGEGGKVEPASQRMTTSGTELCAAKESQAERPVDESLTTSEKNEASIDRGHPEIAPHVAT